MKQCARKVQADMLTCMKIAKVQVDVLDEAKQEVIYSKYAMNTLMSNFIQGCNIYRS